MSRTLSICLLAWALPGVTLAQDDVPSAGALVDSLFRVIRSESVHRGTVRWDSVESRFRGELVRAADYADSLAAFRTVFEALGDVHSSVLHEGRQLNYFRPASSEEAARVGPLVEAANARRGVIENRLLEGNVGYVAVPTIYTSGPEEMVEYAERIRERACALAARGATRWIVDLRLNMGGNMHPMLTGLGPLIGDGPIGGLVGAEGEEVARWSIEGGVNHAEGAPMVALDGSPCELEVGQPIAVLLGPVTMSSGQIVAIALAGRPRTRSFGESTADGYTTANEWKQVRPDLALNLSVAFTMDRTGRVYERVVEPDEVVTGADDFDQPADDPKVRAALDWLGRQP